MKKKSFSFIFSIILLFIVSVSSCTEDWDKHYSPVSEQKSDLNLYDYISKDPSLSSFTKMLKVAGYDTILNKPQTYTVWAPVNSAFPTGSDLDVFLKDTTKVIEIVENHIAHFTYTTSGLTSKKVYLLANKTVKFEYNGIDFTFGGQKISKLNVGTSNGIIHYINNYVSYVKNIWEFIDKTDGLDSLKAFLNANTEKTFDLAGSGHDIGIDKYGQLLYDSVFTITNKIFSRIGYLNLEDSIYTAILPKNNAWTEEYNRIYPNFNTLEKDGGVAKQRENTQFAIVQDLIFRKPQNNPGSLDSLVSTSGNVIYKPGYLFEGSPLEASNGLVYINNSLHNKDTNTWRKEIRIEAESLQDQEWDLTNRASYDLFFNTSYGSGLNISKNEYLYAKKMEVSDLFASYVKFTIGNTLSTKYKIYCVFVPASIDDSTNLFPSKVKYYLTYVNSEGKLITDAPIDNNNVVQAPGKTNGIFLTDPTKIDKMFVTEFQLPYCNIPYDPTSYESMLNYVATVKLRVENAAKKIEGTDSNDGKTKKTANLDLRIDCIILEPVQ